MISLHPHSTAKAWNSKGMSLEPPFTNRKQKKDPLLMGRSKQISCSYLYIASCCYKRLYHRHAFGLTWGDLCIQGIVFRDIFLQFDATANNHC